MNSVQIVFLIIFLLALGLLIFSVTNNAKNRDAMQDILNGTGPNIETSTVVHEMPMEEWRGLVGTELYQYFATHCTNANQPIYEVILAKNQRIDSILEEMEVLEEEEKKFQTVEQTRVLTARSYELRKELLALSDEISKDTEKVDYSLNITVKRIKAPLYPEAKPFSASEQIFGSDTTTGIAIDRKDRQIALLRHRTCPAVQLGHHLSADTDQGPLLLPVFVHGYS
jgi:hypothetical protein